MKTHRFYVADEIKLKADFWVHDVDLLWQWNKVMRFKPGQEVELFDGAATDRLYEIVEISKTEAHLKLITERDSVLPKRHVYLFWCLQKKDVNEHILQKCTEIGVSNFVPILSEKAIKTNFNLDRAEKIVIETSQQCGRSNVPVVREPMHLNHAIEQYKDHLQFIVCQKDFAEGITEINNLDTVNGDSKYGLLVGPKRGWSGVEIDLVKQLKLINMPINDQLSDTENLSILASTELLK